MDRVDSMHTDELFLVCYLVGVFFSSLAILLLVSKSLRGIYADFCVVCVDLPDINVTTCLNVCKMFPGKTDYAFPSDFPHW